MSATIKSLVFVAILFSVLGHANARGSEDLAKFCPENIEQKLTGHTVVLTDVWSGGAAQAYLPTETRTLWESEVTPFIQDDSWRIDDCNIVCWELDRFDDLCTRYMETPWGFNLVDIDTDEVIFEGMIIGEGDLFDFESRANGQKWNPLARLQNWLL